MKIAQLAPPWLSVPPRGYGGTETIVHFLTEGLVKRGHDVTLFASGDSQTSAKLFSVFKEALGNDGTIKRDPMHPLLHYIECFQRADEFDIIHNHAQYYAMFLAHLVKTPVVHTVHGSFSKEYTPEEKIHTLKRFKHHNFISISNHQRKDLEDLNYVATVYNGVDINELSYNREGGNSLLWFGRVTQKKGPVEAIEAAYQVGMKITLAGAIDEVDMDFFNLVVKPFMNNKLVSFQKEIPSSQKSSLLGNAFCTLYPIQWEEPFGLVMTESMACGTPVIAYNRGSVAEIIKDGITGFIVDQDEEDRPGKGKWMIKKTGVEGLVEAIRYLSAMPTDAYKQIRANCHSHVKKHFSLEQMIDGYEEVYKKLVVSSKL